MATELEKIRQEREALELEDLRERVEATRAVRETRKIAHARQEFEIAEAARVEKVRQANCRHKKGGKNKEGFLNGNDSNYSVQRHTYPWGQVEVLCTRCQKTWNKPADALKAADPKAYKAAMEEYRMALEWPTDNEPSGTQLFLITRTAAA